MAIRAAFVTAWCLPRPRPAHQPRHAHVAPALGLRPGSMQYTQRRRAWTTTSVSKIPFGLGLVRAIGVAPPTAPTTLPPTSPTPRRFAAARLVAARPLPSGTQSGRARTSMPLPPRAWTSPPSPRTRRFGTTSVVPRAPRSGCTRPTAWRRHRARHHRRRRHRLRRRRRLRQPRPVSPLRRLPRPRRPCRRPRRQSRPHSHQHRKTAWVREPSPGLSLESSSLSASALQLPSGVLLPPRARPPQPIPLSLARMLR